MRALAFAILLVVGFPPLAIADEPWLGEKVFWRVGAEARDGDKDNVGETKIELEKVPFPATVRGASGEWLWLDKAWVRKADLMLADEALDYYTDRAKEEPKAASNWRARGTVWLAKGKWDYAIKNLSEAIKLDPDDPVSYVNRAAAWSAKGDLDRAIADYDEALRADPTNVINLNMRGLLWRNKGDLDKAIADFTEAIRIDPNASFAYNFRGSVWSAKHQHYKAIQDFTESIRINPDDPVGYVSRAMVSTKRAEYEKAIADYQKALELAPDSVMALNGYAWLRAACAEGKNRDGAEAVRCATRACELSGFKIAAMLDTLAASCAEANDFAAAIKWEKKAIELADESRREVFTGHLKLFESGKPYHDSRK